MFATLFRRAGRVAAVLAAGLALSLGWSTAGRAQQQGTISGTVTDASTLKPVSGAQVYLPGLNLGTLAGEDGKYRIPDVPAGSHELRVRLLGYKVISRNVTVRSGQTTTVDLQLEPSAVGLKEVVVNVVTGVRQQRRDIGTNAANINASQVNQTSVSSFNDLLSGRASGVVVQNVSGTTGTSQHIRIRGANSISLSNEPLVYIDGVRVSAGAQPVVAGGTGGQEPSALNDLNPENISNVQVIKGPAAAALYGSNAANGVILITTKHGTNAETRFHVWGELGDMNDMTSYPPNVSSLMRIGPGPVIAPGANGGINASAFTSCPNVYAAQGACTQDVMLTFNPLLDPRTTPFTLGHQDRLGGSLTGGGNEVTYFLSGDRQFERNVISYNVNTRTSATATFNVQANDKFNVGMNVMYLANRLILPQNDNDIFSPILNGIYGSAAYLPGTGAYGGNMGSYLNYGFFFSPDELRSLLQIHNTDRLTIGGNMDWNPTPWLLVHANGGLDLNDIEDAQTLQPNLLPIATSYALGYRDNSRTNDYNYTANGSVQATFDLTQDVTSATLLGAHYEESRTGVTECYGYGIVPGLASCDATSQGFFVNENFSRLRTVAGFGQEQLSWRDRMYLTFGLRVDNNSAFGGNIGAQFYPSANFSYVMSEEPWFPKSNILSSFRVRAGWGVSGLRPGFRQAQTLFSSVVAIVNGSQTTGVTINSTGNPGLKPERITEYEGGFDAGFLNERLGLQLTYYHKTSKDALVAKPLPPSYGLTGTVFDNIGKVQNYGFEASLNATALDQSAVGLDLGVSMSTNHNEVLTLGGVPSFVVGRAGQSVQEGLALGAYKQIPYTYSDANGDGIIVPSEITLGDSSTFINESLPTWEGSISADLRLFDFIHVNTLFEARGGNGQFDLTTEFDCVNSYLSNRRGCPETDNPNAPLANQARFAAYGYLGTNAGYVGKAAFMKWRELSIRMNAPQSLASAMPFTRGLSLTLAARNLHTFTGYNGIDPEIIEQGGNTQFNQGEFNTQPAPRIFTARVDVSF
ncbi:MAG: SusC/RagA family TonB-linked outer membrane protein [Candidatus Palauibacterales bacterium]|nr:SusC/RagA family TonB-linked outer membrane protein [Candidatus Palauibacterales bacterium]MDP2528271.1 SusC/RagA family TonB-linked outer membrane protein [Candidatus Palauibacterales bacterium]MDP2584832.1 SusC/RagA family TonB-linked outer membrane protein [Candidatus Palauibacterales bacterium]